MVAGVGVQKNLVKVVTHLNLARTVPIIRWKDAGALQSGILPATMEETAVKGITQ